MNNPLVVAVVLNWNSADETIECIHSLLNSSYKNLQIVIVDNFSADDSVNVIKKTFPTIKLICNSFNNGYAGGNNLGIKWALNLNADYILILNNDVTVDFSMVSVLVESIEKNEKIGLISGKVFYKGNTNRIFSGAGRFIKWRCTGVNRGTNFGRFYSHNREGSVNYISGVLFLARADVFKKVGLLDEKYFMYFEDLEFSFRVSKKYILYFNPDAISYHKSGGGTRWSNYSEIYLYYQTRNRLIVFEDKNIIYRIYVLFFTLFITIAKSLAILFTSMSENSFKKKRIKALWRGLKDGLFYNISKKVLL
jgi:GT2 family glycosyltransferase